MLNVIRRLSPGLALIAGVSAILLLSDLNHRMPARPRSPEGVTQQIVPSAPVYGPALDRTWKVALVRYSDTHFAEEATKGLEQGFVDAGLVKGRDYVLDIKSAQGDMVTLNTIFDAIKTQGADLIVVFSTPTLQAAIRKFDKTPIVFSVVASAVLAGAGKTDSDHRPNVTGITTRSAFEEMAKILKACMPSARRVGTVFVPSEINSVYNKDSCAEALRQQGIELEAVPANTSAEYSDAAQALAGKDIDAVCQIADNLSVVSFPTVAKAAGKRGLPVFAFESSLARQGAVLVVSRDYYDAGREGALLAARVMRGENTAIIPFTVVGKTQMVINLPQANKVGLAVPESVIGQAQEVIR